MITVSYVCLDGEQAISLIDFFFVSQFTLKILSYLWFLFQVNDVNFENMSNDDAVRVLREMVHKPGYAC